jgi:hypothetical protein
VPDVVVLDGEMWAWRGGSLDVVDYPHSVIRHRDQEEAMDYLGDHGLDGESPRIGLFRRMDFATPAAHKRWADLSERTKQGYRGRLRSVGVRTDADMARFHDSADSETLKWLRRHGPRPPELVVVEGRPAYPARGTGSWATVWEQKRR